MKQVIEMVAVAVAGVCAILMHRMRLKVDAEREKSVEKGIEVWARYHSGLTRRPIYWLLLVVALLCLSLVWYLLGLGS